MARAGDLPWRVRALGSSVTTHCTAGAQTLTAAHRADAATGGQEVGAWNALGDMKNHPKKCGSMLL